MGDLQHFIVLQKQEDKTITPWMVDGKTIKRVTEERVTGKRPRKRLRKTLWENTEKRSMKMQEQMHDRWNDIVAAAIGQYKTQLNY